MHFTQREQAALREVGLSQENVADASDHVVEATREAAADLRDFFADVETVYSDMDIAHSDGAIQEHAFDYLDLYTHADDIRGYLRFEGWGVPVTGGRVLSDDVVELTLGPTVDDRVRFSPDRDAL